MGMLVVLLLTGCSDGQITGEVVKEFNLSLSVDAYLEIDGEAVPLPCEVIKVDEEYGYFIENFDDLGLNLSEIRSLRVIDGGEEVYSYSLFTGGFKYGDLMKIKQNKCGNSPQEKANF